MARTHWAVPAFAPLLGTTLLLTLISASMAASPRGELAARGLDFTADAFVERAGAGDLDAVKLYLAAGMDVNARSCCHEPLSNPGRNWGQHHHSRAKAKGDSTALMSAAENGRQNVVMFLLESGAAVDARNNGHDTALRLAVEGAHREVVHLLLQHGANANAASAGSSPLRSATLMGNVEIAQLLLGHHADPGAADGRGVTPLHLAAKLGYVELVRLLLLHSAPVNARTLPGPAPSETPLDMANHPEIVRLLRAAGGKKDSELH